MTVHVPGAVYDRVVPTTEQLAVPAEVTTYVTVPEPRPPVVVKAANRAGEVTDCAVKVRVVCVPFAMVTVVATDETTL